MEVEADRSGWDEVSAPAPVSAGNPLVVILTGVIMLVATLATWVTLDRPAGLDPAVLFVLWFNVLLASIAVSIEVGRRPYSLHVMHLVSMFLFLGAASVLQYSQGILTVLGSIRIVEDQVFRASICTTLWLSGYLIGYELYHRRRVPPPGRFLSRPLNLPRAVSLGFVGFLGIVYLAALGLLGASTRGAATSAIGEFSEAAGAGGFTRPLFIINMNLARALPPVSLLAVLLAFLRGQGGNRVVLFPFVIALGIGTLLANNPFAASRMFFTAIGLAFVSPFLLRHFRSGALMVAAVAAGMTILPAMGETRHALDFSELSSYFQLMSPLDYLARSSDVDSLGMTALCQQYVDLFGLRWGLQFGGAFLFWFPRFLWPSKPVGTGTLVTESLGYDFTNLSPPIQAEFLVNFGLVGVFFGAMLFGVILSRLDSIYWSIGRQGLGTSQRLIDVFYPFWLGCVVYFTRGDFLPALVFTISFSIWLVPLGLGLRSQPAGAGGAPPT